VADDPRRKGLVTLARLSSREAWDAEWRAFGMEAYLDALDAIARYRAAAHRHGDRHGASRLLSLLVAWRASSELTDVVVAPPVAVSRPCDGPRSRRCSTI
jgi:hypothetical protein